MSASIRCAAAAAALCVPAIAPSAASADVTYAANCGVTGYLEYKPDYWSAGCTGGSPTIRPIHWRVWKGSAATSGGTALLREPCGDQPCYKAGVYRAKGKLGLSRPRTCVSDDGETYRYFSRARWSIRYRPGNPFHERPGWRSLTFKVPADSGCSLS